MVRRKKQGQTTRRSLSDTQIKNLAKRALKNKPKYTPAKGYKFLKDLKVGSLFTTESGMRGVLISCETNANIIVTESYNSDQMGKKHISSHTEVKEIIKI